jgi:hypothetical protein
LKCLYINEANSNAESPWQLYRTIKGIRVLASLEELSRLYADKDDIEELGHLTELKVLDIVVSCGDLKLVDCLHKLQNIQNLSIYLSAGGLKGWVGPQSLRSLQVDNPWFPKLLVWINHSHARKREAATAGGHGNPWEATCSPRHTYVVGRETFYHL